MPGWKIEEVDFAGGFLHGVKLRLATGLTCVIGPRGSGKSTLVEALRYAVAGASDASKRRSDLIEANLQSVTLTARTADGPKYLITRGPRMPLLLTTGDGKIVTAVDLDRGTFLPLDGYNNYEIEEIADESLGPRRRALLDELRPEELRVIEANCANFKRDLDSNADTIKLTQQQISDMTEQVEELREKEEELNLLGHVPSSEIQSSIVALSKQHEINKDEIVLVNEISSLLKLLNSEIGGASERIASIAVGPLINQASKNTTILGYLPRQFADMTMQIQGGFGVQRQAVDEFEKNYQSIISELTVAHSVQYEAYSRARDDDEILSKEMQLRANLERAVARLNALQANKVVKSNDLIELMKIRARLKARLLHERERLSEIREATARSLQSMAGTTVRLGVIRNADDWEYRQVIATGLRGARVRSHDEIIDTLMLFRPEELAQVIRDSDVDTLNDRTGLGPERSKRILDAFQVSLDTLSLEILPIDDKITIELNVGRGDHTIFKDAANLSRGQKCTALLPLLMARRNSPLVIDQPEDNLDNHFIYETVVETVRRIKLRRQMIFVTHNANIPVLAEADLIIVLNSNGKSGFIEKKGTVDECRDEIIDLLEGGRDAFESRRRRYAS